MGLAEEACELLRDDEVEPRPGAHERFIEEFDRADKVVLGGALKPAGDPYHGAYLLSCGSLDEARAIAASAPLARAGVVRCDAWSGSSWA